MLSVAGNYIESRQERRRAVEYHNTDAGVEKRVWEVEADNWLNEYVRNTVRNHEAAESRFFEFGEELVEHVCLDMLVEQMKGRLGGTHWVEELSGYQMIKDVGQESQDTAMNVFQDMECDMIVDRSVLEESRRVEKTLLETDNIKLVFPNNPSLMNLLTGSATREQQAEDQTDKLALEERCKGVQNMKQAEKLNMVKTEQDKVNLKVNDALGTCSHLNLTRRQAVGMVRKQVDKLNDQGDKLEEHDIMIVNKVVSPRISRLSRLFEPGPKMENMEVDMTELPSEEGASDMNNTDEYGVIKECGQQPKLRKVLVPKRRGAKWKERVRVHRIDDIFAHLSDKPGVGGMGVKQGDRSKRKSSEDMMVKESAAKRQKGE